MKKIAVLQYKSTEYAQQVQLRSLVLREPLGLQFSEADLEKDANNILFGYFSEENKLLGCCQLQPKKEGIFQLRQMAVDPAYQGRNIGKALMIAAEKYVLENMGIGIELHARKVAIPFYLKLGYQQEGTEFTEVGIPHFSMYKKIN